MLENFDICCMPFITMIFILLIKTFQVLIYFKMYFFEGHMEVNKPDKIKISACILSPEKESQKAGIGCSHLLELIKIIFTSIGNMAFKPCL